MKEIPSNTGSATWASSLIADIAIIKKKLRYPIKGATLTPIIFWSFVIVLMVVASIALIAYTQDERPIWVKMLLGFSGLFLISAIIIRHIQALRFISIPTPYLATENALLLEQFLKAEHMLIFRHPDAPEIFQIQSRNLNMKSLGKEDREIMIFIADDKRILINSHFTDTGWSPNPGVRHHAQFAKMLQQYINDQSHTTGISHQTF